MSKAPAAVVACITTKYQATRVAGGEVTAVNVSSSGRVRPALQIGGGTDCVAEIDPLSTRSKTGLWNLGRVFGAPPQVIAARDFQ